jgi:regulatory protein
MSTMRRPSFSQRKEPPEHADSESRIRSVGIALQTYREHGAKELEAKLTRKGYDSLTTAQVVEELRESGLVSDQRFAEAYVRGHAARGHGPIRIRHDLKELGVPSELITVALDSEEFDWADMAADVRRRKFGETAPKVFTERAKQMRFLQYRGFSSSQIRAAFNSDIDQDVLDPDLD